MMSPASNLRRSRTSSRGTFLRRLLGVLLLLALVWSVYVYQQITEVASEDQAQPADAIAVFGAAEYGGRPSPVFHARLDHAVALYRRQIAPLVITLGGGSDKDSGLTEGGVGRDYLLANGIPFANILAETRSVDTEQQVHRLAAIAREHRLHHIVVVSDGTHLFRIRELCEEAGLEVSTSPRPTLGHISNYDLFLRYVHEILSYTSLRLDLHGSWIRRWLEGRE
jgi:uncharacterized SAM-binding protein YcdF (DUF218 family)